VKIDKEGGFIGRDAVARQKADGVTRKLVGLEIDGQAIARHGYEVLNAEGDTVVGEITTGYHSISLDRNIAFALVQASVSAIDTPLQVRVRRKTFPARVVKKRFYTPNYKK
jgi:aminomethyltransferase